MELETYNPLIKNKMELNTDSGSIEITRKNLSRYFKKVYVICPFKNEPISENIYFEKIKKENLEDMYKKLLITEASLKLVINSNHFYNLILMDKEDLEKFNHFGLELSDKNLVLPILNISFLNLQNYLKLAFGHYNFRELYNTVFLTKNFKSNNYQRMVNVTEMIKLLEENYYWTRSHNCNINITDEFINRRLSEKKNININKQNTNYLSSLSKKKYKHVDISNGIYDNNYIKYRINKSPEINIDEFNVLYQTLNDIQKKHLIFYLMSSKHLCHLVVNNRYILDEINKMDQKKDIKLLQYCLGYSWLKFYFDECIKKRNITKDDDFIFDINTASKLKAFPVSKDYKQNPYLPILVDDKELNRNIMGISFNRLDNLGNNVICNFDEFMYRFNIFITGSKDNYLFKDIDFKKYELAISGSIITACLQKNHPLLSILKDPEGNMEKLFDRYFDEFYGNSDVDFMIRGHDIIEFIKKVKMIYNQIRLNVIEKNIKANLDDIKIEYIKTIFLFVKSDFVKDKIVNDEFSFNYIINNINNKEVIDLFKPYIEEKLEEYYYHLLENYSKDEVKKIKEKYKELFDDSINKIQITIQNNNFGYNSTLPEINTKIDTEKLENEIDNIDEANKMEYHYERMGLEISMKAKISSKHFKKTLELFCYNADDPFYLVSSFHLPCVRGYFQGDNVYLTPSCISSHLTYINLDYKYFAGSKDPCEIINKYRFRGFGTILNRYEINNYLTFTKNNQYWSKEYNLSHISKQSTKQLIGFLSINNPVFRKKKYVEVVKFNYKELDPQPIENFNPNEIYNVYFEQFYGDHIDSDKVYRTVLFNGKIKPLNHKLIDKLI